MAGSADFGLIGLGVMGENLVLNVESRGFTVAVYNRTTEKVDAFLQGRGAGKKFVGAHSIEELVQSLRRPRRIMILVKAGPAVDAVIRQLEPHVEKGDVVIDGGNSYWEDTARREKELEAKGLLFVGTGVSGGEEGALKGPSMMPGGHEEAWPLIKPIFQAIAARVNETEVACDWVGRGGAGHFVKMIHNGIEYGDIQIICEAYHLLRELYGMQPAELAQVFAEWNSGDLESYLIEITADIFRTHDEETGRPVVDLILDRAGQKGTGRWTVINSLDMGVPVTLIGEAVYARAISAMKEERVAASKALTSPPRTAVGEKDQFLADLRGAVLASKMVSYAQGFALMEVASRENDWSINKGSVAMMWRAGCIIRSSFLGKIRDAYRRDDRLNNLLLDPYFKDAVQSAQAGWRRVVAEAVLNGIPVPAMSSALAYFDSYRTENLPANLLQAMRDYFGAHTYERIDREPGKFFHTNWTGEGGTTTADTYNA